MRRLALVLTVILGACATEADPQLTAEVGTLRSEIARAIQAVEVSIQSQTFETLGESVGRLEMATHALGEVESREDAEDAVRAQAALLQARAWDDLARALFQPESGESDATSSALQASLRQKALPARVAALAAYERTRSLLCQFGLGDDPAMIESLDGITRYSGRASVEGPCD